MLRPSNASKATSSTLDKGHCPCAETESSAIAEFVVVETGRGADALARHVVGPCGPLCFPSQGEMLGVAHPRIIEPRQQRKFFVAYQGARDAFLRQVVDAIGSRMAVIDYPGTIRVIEPTALRMAA